MIQRLQILRLFVLSFPRNNNTDSRYSYSNYYVPKVKTSDFNVLIDGKMFFDLPLKMEKKPMKNLLKWVIIIMAIQLVIH